MEIIPSLVPHDYFDIEEKVNKIEGLVTSTHLDIVDGNFAKPATWPYTQDDFEGEIRNFADLSTSLKIGIHLMVKNPEDTLDEWIDTQAKRITVHYGSTENIMHVLRILEMSKIESGVALNLDTEIDVLDEIAPHVDVIHLMSITKIGGYGAEFHGEVIEKIKKTRKKYPGHIIVVDGGVSENNIKSLADAGATEFIVGNFVFGSGNVVENLSKLNKALN